MIEDVAWSNRPARLLEAARFIEAIPDIQRNMDHWWLPDGMAFDDDRNIMYRVTDGPCGCAVGHMAHKGLWGLSELIDAHDGKFKNSDREVVFTVVARTFGIPQIVARYLFDQYAYTGTVETKQVVKRMRLVAEEAGFVDE